MSLTGKQKRLDLGLGLAVFAVAVVLRFIYQYHQFDDAFITFRYALNLVRGHGFVYNEGCRVLGTTTPLFTGVLAALGFVFRTENFPLLANVVNHLADGGTAVLLYIIGRRIWRSRALALLLGLFFATAFHSVFYSGTGMETEFYSFLTLFALERALRRRWRAAWLLAALALMTRPDALLLFAALAAYALLWDRRRFRPAQAWPAAALLLPYAAALWLYFGSLVPQSMVAKSMMWGTVNHPFSLTLPNWYEVMMFWGGFLSKSHSQKYLFNVLRFWPMAALVALGCLELARRRRRMLLLPAFGLFFTLAYAKTSVYLFPWYLVPTVPYLTLMVFAAIKLLGELFARALRLNPRRAGLAVCTLMLGVWCIVFVGGPRSLPSAIVRAMYPNHTERLYREALARIHPNKKPFVIMAPELGYIGYYCPDARIIDPVGLTNPEITDYYRAHPERMPQELHFVNLQILEAFQPDYVIVLEAFVEHGLERQPEFLRNYEIVPVPLDRHSSSSDNPEQVLLYKKRERPSA